MCAHTSSQQRQQKNAMTYIIPHTCADDTAAADDYVRSSFSTASISRGHDMEITAAAAAADPRSFCSPRCSVIGVYIHQYIYTHVRVYRRTERSVTSQKYSPCIFFCLPPPNMIGRPDGAPDHRIVMSFTLRDLPLKLSVWG